MVNKNKVRLMARTAIYEKHNGKEDFKVTAYGSSDYIRFNLLKTLVGITISVLLASFVYVLYSSEDVFQIFFKLDLQALGRLVIVAYILSLGVYVIVSILYYQYNYSKAKKRVKHYNKNLIKIKKYSRSLSEVKDAGGNE